MNWPEDFVNKVHCKDAFEFMKSIPSGVIDMCITSPPYWGLRDYGIEQIFGGDKNCEHDFSVVHRRANDKSGGHENAGYIEAEKAQDAARFGPPTKTCHKCHAWKGQLGLEPIPELYIEHMTEIFNEVKRVLKKEGTLWLNIGDTYGGSGKGSGDDKPDPKFKGGGRERTLMPDKTTPAKCLLMIPERLAWSLIQNGWILRNKIPWIKPNCMPFSGKDRFTNKWEHVYYFVKSQRNYFDLDSAREPHKSDTPRAKRDLERMKKGRQQYKGTRENSGYQKSFVSGHPKGKNPGDIWIIPTAPCPIKGIHFATFPEELCKKAIIPGCPEGGIVLDPFCGVGTACYVARKLGRKYIGIDIKPEFCEKAENIRLAQGVL